MYENDEITTSEGPVEGPVEAPVTSVAGEPDPQPTDGTAEPAVEQEEPTPDVPTNDQGEPIPDVQPGTIVPSEEKPEE